MAVKLLISDLDGSLLGPENTITDRTACALQRAQQSVLSKVMRRTA